MAVPSIADLTAIALTTGEEFELSDKETQTLRSRLYAYNKAGHLRFRTLRDAPYTYVWRIK